jgi:hypothetical protein
MLGNIGSRASDGAPLHALLHAYAEGTSHSLAITSCDGRAI